MMNLFWNNSIVLVLSQVVGRKIGTKSDRRFHRLPTLNTPSMLALMLSQGSSLWVFLVCYLALISQIIFWCRPPIGLCTGHARAMGPTAPDVKHHQVGAEEKPAGCAGCSQVLRLDRQRSPEVPQLFLLWCGSQFSLLTCARVIYCLFVFKQILLPSTEIGSISPHVNH